MPRKKTTTKEAAAVPVLEKKVVAASFNETKVLLGDKIAQAVADLVNENSLDRSNAARVTSVLQNVASSCVDTIRANKGF